MRCFLPDIRLASELPEQAKLEDKLGGVPWGLPEDLWPECADCGKHQSLLAQFVHDGNRLDLGREGRVLFVFQCSHEPGMCDAQAGGSGANACFVLEAEDLTDGLSPLPDDSPPLDLEVRIVGWREMDDGVEELQATEFFDADAFDELPEELRTGLPNVTHLGGVPSWVQGPEGAPRDGWRFLGHWTAGTAFSRRPRRRCRTFMRTLSTTWGGRTSVRGPASAMAAWAIFFSVRQTRRMKCRLVGFSGRRASRYSSCLRYLPSFQPNPFSSKRSRNPCERIAASSRPASCLCCDSLPTAHGCTATAQGMSLTA